MVFDEAIGASRNVCCAKWKRAPRNMYNVDSFPRFETRCCFMFVPPALLVVRLFQQLLLSLIQESMVECRDEAASVLFQFASRWQVHIRLQSVSISDLCSRVVVGVNAPRRAWFFPRLCSLAVYVFNALADCKMTLPKTRCPTLLLTSGGECRDEAASVLFQFASRWQVHIRLPVCVNLRPLFRELLLYACAPTDLFDKLCETIPGRHCACRDTCNFLPTLCF